MQPNLIWRERSSSGGADERRRTPWHGHRPSIISAVPVTALRTVCSASRGRRTTLRTSSTLPGYSRTNWAIIKQIELARTPGLESRKTDTRTIGPIFWFQETNNRTIKRYDSKDEDWKSNWKINTRLRWAERPISCGVLQETTRILLIKL